MADITDVQLSSGRVAGLRKLTARQQMNADVASKGDGIKIGYYRISMALAKLGRMVAQSDGEPKFEGELFEPASNDLLLESRIDLLDGQEIDELAMAYQTKFSPSVQILKNVLSAASPDSSQQQ